MKNLFTVARAIKMTGVAILATAFANVSHAQFNVLWWDSTPEYGGQAPNAQRKEMSDYLTTYNGGTVFNSTYVGSEVAGTLATQLAAHTYDVIVFDATSDSAKFNAADLTAIQAFYANNNKNLLLDGTLYIRSIVYDAGSDFPGVGSSTGGLTVNEVNELAQRGGGIMIGTDHQGFQVDANQVLHAILPGASFSGITFPSTDGVFFGSDLLNSTVPVAASNIFNHWDSIDTQAVAPTGVFTDFLGASVTLLSQVSVADAPGGGQKLPYISTSWAPGGGSTVVTDPNPGGTGGGGNTVPDGGTTASLLGLSFVAMLALRRKS